jgi:hypothetical protein
VAQSEINISIGDESPDKVFAGLRAQVVGGPLRFGGITDRKTLEGNLTANCIPLSMLDGEAMSFDEFLIERRKLMARRIKTWFEGLGE